MTEKNPFAQKWLHDQFNERNPGQRNHPDYGKASAPCQPEGPIKYTVWGRVERSGEQFTALAHAVPSAQARGFAISRQAVFDTESAAQEGLGRLKIEVAEQARAEGHVVVDPETDGV
jgi:hypothetical protein